MNDSNTNLSNTVLPKFLIIGFIILVFIIIGGSIIFFTLIPKNNPASSSQNTSPTISTSLKITESISPTTSSSTSVPTTVVTTNSSNSLKSYSDSLDNWSLSYPSDWVVSKESASGSQYTLFRSPDIQTNSTNHKGLFSVDKNGKGYAIKSYDQCVQNADNFQGQPGMGHTLTQPVKLQINGNNACKYTETNTDGSLYNVINTYVFVKNSSGKTITISFAEDRPNSSNNNYPVSQWIYADKFNNMLNSFKY